MDLMMLLIPVFFVGTMICESQTDFFDVHAEDFIQKLFMDDESKPKATNRHPRKKGILIPLTKTTSRVFRRFIVMPGCGRGSKTTKEPADPCQTVDAIEDDSVSCRVKVAKGSLDGHPKRDRCNAKYHRHELRVQRHQANRDLAATLAVPEEIFLDSVIAADIVDFENDRFAASEIFDDLGDFCLSDFGADIFFKDDTAPCDCEELFLNDYNRDPVRPDDGAPRMIFATAGGDPKADGPADLAFFDDGHFQFLDKVGRDSDNGLIKSVQASLGFYQCDCTSGSEADVVVYDDEDETVYVEEIAEAFAAATNGRDRVKRGYRPRPIEEDEFGWTVPESKE